MQFLQRIYIDRRAVSPLFKNSTQQIQQNCELGHAAPREIPGTARISQPACIKPSRSGLPQLTLFTPLDSDTSFLHTLFIHYIFFPKLRNYSFCHSMLYLFYEFVAYSLLFHFLVYFIQYISTAHVNCALRVRLSNKSNLKLYNVQSTVYTVYSQCTVCLPSTCTIRTMESRVYTLQFTVFVLYDRVLRALCLPRRKTPFVMRTSSPNFRQTPNPDFCQHRREIRCFGGFFRPFPGLAAL